MRQRRAAALAGAKLLRAEVQRHSGVETSDSDSDDPDFVPDAKELSDKGKHEDVNGTVSSEVEAALAAERRRKIDEIWAAMKQEGHSTAVKNETRTQEVAQHRETVETSTDRTEAQQETTPSNTVSNTDKEHESVKDDSATAIANDASTSMGSGDVASAESATKEKASLRPPLRRRRRKDFEALAASYLGTTDTTCIRSSKKQKVNTLEKSKQDWELFVQREGIRDELTYANKNGYLEKRDFLDRATERGVQELKAMKAQKAHR